MPALAHGEVLDVTRAVLDVEINALGHGQAGRFGRRAHLGVVGDVVFLAGRARAAVGDVDGDRVEVRHVGAVGRIRGDAAVGIAGMGDHGLDGREVDDVDAAVVDRTFVRSDRQGALRVEVEVRHALAHPRVEQLVGLADAGAGAAFRGHVAQGGALVNGKRCKAGPAELHAAVEGQLLAGVVGEDVENDVLCGATGMKFAHQFEADGFGHLDEGEAGADKVRVLGRADAVGQRVRGAAHAGVAVRGLNEIAHFDEFLTRHLMADAG